MGAAWVEAVRTVYRGRRRAGLLTLVVILAAGACGQGAAARTQSTGDDILVGASISLSGSLGAEGQRTKQGYLMWLEWVNGQGGIVVAGVRHKVRLLLEDDQGRPDLAEGLARKLITQDTVHFLLGPYGSTTTAAVAAVADRAAIPLVEAMGAAMSIFSQGYRYVFAVLSPSDQYMAGVIDMAANLVPRPRTIALLAADDSFSLEVAQSVRAYAPRRGFEVVFSQQYPAGSTELRSLVTQARSQQPDILMNSGHLAEAVAIHRAAKELQLNAKLFAYSVGPSTLDYVPTLGPDADYVFSGSQWTPQVRYRPQMYLTVRDFRAAYKRMFRTLDEPSYHVAGGTAAGLALERAIENAGSLRPDRVRDALAGLDVTTFYGRIRFDPRGVNVYKPMLVEQIQRGRHRTVHPPELADARPEYPTPPWSER